MGKWEKFLWGGLGWALGGPIGAVIGFAVGSIAHEAIKVGNDGSSDNRTLPGDFGSVLLIFCAAIVKADGQVKGSEINFVRNYFKKLFGDKEIEQRMQIFESILGQNIQLGPICAQVSKYLDYESKVQLVHLLFGLAHSDQEFHADEERLIKEISQGIGVTLNDYNSLRSMFGETKTSTWAYETLGVTSTASNDELKKAYRAMAIKHHPDKVHHLGEEFQKSAQEKFKKVNEAWEHIKKEKNIV